MNPILKDIYTAILSTLFFTVILCGFYPLAIWSLGQLFFSHQAHGSLVRNSVSQVVGSELIGQNFTAPKYFHPRPSSAGDGYDATSSGGSNLGPTSQKLMDAVKARVETYRAENQLPMDVLVPADAVMASASGLDPHISIKNALLQIPRIAQVRRISRDAVKSEVMKASTTPLWNVFGEPRVNVLRLNLALDQLTSIEKPNK